MDADVKYNCRLSTKIGGFAVASFIRGLMGTLDFQIAHYDPSADPAQPEYSSRCIYVFWHEYIAFPTALWGNYGLAVLISQHRDGDWISRAAYHLGFDVVRGSTTRGSTSALRTLKRKSRELNLTMTPDGPQGPRREMSLGPIYLSSRLGVPLVAVGFGYDRPFRMPTWDRFAVPRPYTRARAIFGPRMPIPRRLDREGLEHYRVSVEQMLNCLTQEAENWAESGTRKAGQRPFPRHRRIEPLLHVEQPRIFASSCDDDLGSVDQESKRSNVRRLAS